MIVEYYVEIWEHKKQEMVKQMGPFSERKADKLDDGVHINLNHDEFYTVIEPANKISP